MRYGGTTDFENGMPIHRKVTATATKNVLAHTLDLRMPLRKISPGGFGSSSCLRLRALSGRPIS